MKSLTFTQMPLDRCTVERKNPLWVDQQRQDSSSLIIPHWRGRYLFQRNQLVSGAAAHIQGFDEAALQTAIFLGQCDNNSHFVVDLSIHEEAKLLDYFNAEAIEFRAALPLIDQDYVPVLGYGNALAHWHRQSEHCGRCGHKTQVLEGGHSRQCANDKCQGLVFPRTDPVVIMLVTHVFDDGIERCLLATHHRIKSNVFSTLAGFIDPGESIEEAVRREVKEEAGVNVVDVTYLASQPWPFPSSLMIGCTAVATDPRLNIDYDEISGAQWFTKEEVAAFDNWGDEGENNQLPRQESIARALIDHWLGALAN